MLSSTRDYPLLRQVLHSRLITHNQLFAFLKLDYCVASRNSFNNRVLRLVKHGLLLRHEARPFSKHEVVYSISERGASELIGGGECCSLPDRTRIRNALNQLNHCLELNEIHLALKRTGSLVYWVSESEIRSRNELTDGYSKHYDAIVTVRLAEQDYKLALEYERTPKAARHYEAILEKIEMETTLFRFLYLAPGRDLLCYVADKLKRCSRTLYFGLLRDFLELKLAIPVQTNGSPVSLSLAGILMRGKEVQRTGNLFPPIGV